MTKMRNAAACPAAQVIAAKNDTIAKTRKIAFCGDFFDFRRLFHRYAFTRDFMSAFLRNRYYR
jgi:hypothetical protein